MGSLSKMWGEMKFLMICSHMTVPIVSKVKPSARYNIINRHHSDDESVPSVHLRGAHCPWGCPSTINFQVAYITFSWNWLNSICKQGSQWSKQIKGDQNGSIAVVDGASDEGFPDFAIGHECKSVALFRYSIGEDILKYPVMWDN
jgi:hypothetical protein